MENQKTIVHDSMRPLKIIVLAKQVPDTRHVGPDAMKPDGTVNRGKLPTVFNPDDFHALELALNIKDRVPGTEVVILTMGPKKAADIIREGYYRGADNSLSSHCVQKVTCFRIFHIFHEVLGVL